MVDALTSSFRRLWVATATANVADGILLVGLPLVAVGLTRSPWQVSLVSTLATAPRLVVSLHAGALADRHDRRVLMLLAMVGRVAVLVLLAGVAVGGGIGLGALYAAVVLLGVAEVFADTTAQSMIPMLVGSDQLSAANGRVVAAQTVANDFLGGPLAGVLAGAGAAAVAGAPAVAYLLAGLVLWTLAGDFRPARDGDSTLGGDIVEALRLVAADRALRSLAILVGLLNLAGAAYLAVFVLWAVGEGSVLELDPAAYGLLMAALAVGGTVGAVSVERLCRRRGEVTWLRVSAGALPLLFLIPVWVPDPAVTAAVFVAIGMAAAIHKVLVASLTQRLVTHAELGRVNATMRLVGLGTMPVGAVLGGVLGSAAGLATVFHAAAGLCLAGLLVIVPKGTGQAIRSAGLSP